MTKREQYADSNFLFGIDAMNENVVSSAQESIANAFCLLACVFSCPDENEAFYGCFCGGVAYEA